MSRLHDYSVTPSCMSLVSLQPNNSKIWPCRPQQVTLVAIMSVNRPTASWLQNTHLVVAHHNLSGSMQNPILCELFRPSDLQRQLVKLCLVLGPLAIFWHYLLPDVVQNHVVVNPYILFLTVLLVYAVVQLDMITAAWIVPGQECLATPMLCNIFLICSKLSM